MHVVGFYFTYTVTASKYKSRSAYIWELNRVRDVYYYRVTDLSPVISPTGKNGTRVAYELEI